MPSTVVRDPIHNLVRLTDEEWAVVDSPAFQRLRSVQQLALTDYVYPGARHTRFEHCIGACHVAGSISAAIDADEEETRRVRLAALVHDIGHGPFSHVSEEVFEDLAAAAHPNGHVHEKASAAIVTHHEPIVDAIGADTATWIAELLSGTGHGKVRTIWRDVVAGPADVDKLDYLLRDSHYCGVNYGRYDLHKLTESAVAIPDGKQSYLGFRADGIYALEEMLLARHHMHRQVYGHKTRVATDLMLRRAMRDGTVNGPLPAEVFAPPAEMDSNFTNQYLHWDDRRVVDALLADGDGVHHDIAEDLLRRRLVKRVAVLPYEQLAHNAGGLGQAAYLLSSGGEGNSSGIAQAEERIAEELNVPVHSVHLHWSRLGDPLGRTSRTGLTAKAIMLRSEHHPLPQDFHELSEVFGSVNVDPAKDRIVVYCRPPDGADPDAFPQQATEVACEALAHVEEPV